MQKLTSDLLKFLDASPCNFWAVKNIADRLDAAGFQKLDMRNAWELLPGGKYYVTKNASAVFAFIAGSDPLQGYHIVCAHSDSPGFRIKPNSEMAVAGRMLKLNTEVYGGPILYTWFDRPLSIAGRVVLEGSNPLEPEIRLVKFGRPLLTIPHLAIHYNRSVNDGNPLSRQRDMLPLMGLLHDGEQTEGYIRRLVAAELGVAPAAILDFDLTLYDPSPACVFGPGEELLSASRIDDLEMAHAALSALLSSAADEPALATTRVMAIFDNEETGSGTKQGAASPILRTILTRINRALGGSAETYSRAIASSFMISADNGHATHPNYECKQDPTNHPVLGGGPVIKINANCKYMTDAESSAVFQMICRKADIPVQMFVNHSDVAGGSTLGNILTSQIDLRGVDMGAPQLAMHSCRETAAVADHLYTVKAFRTFYNL